MKRVIALIAALVIVVFYVQSVFGQMGSSQGIQWIDNGQNRSTPSVAQRTTTAGTTAGWTNVGRVNGIQVYRDERTGLEWTVTIGQVQSSGWGDPARALAARYGFRLPSFRELQVMEANGGFRPLKINTRMQQYYETSDSNVLAAAWGNGFRTPQQRLGRGMNWVIGVRQGGGGNQGTQQVVVPPGNQSSNVRLLFIFGTKDENELFKRSMKNSIELLRTLINESQLNKIHLDDASSSVSSAAETLSLELGVNGTVLAGNKATRNNILATVKRFCEEAGPNGAVLVYYLGHGATVTLSGKNIHLFYPLMDGFDELGEPTARTDIYNTLLAGKNRFAGLISDSCSNILEGVIAEHPPEVAGDAGPGAISALRALLLYGRGTVDISSSDPTRKNIDGGLGQVAIFQEQGAFFTVKFAKEFGVHKMTKAAFTKNDFNETINDVQRGINLLYSVLTADKYRVQGGQNIYIFHNTLQ